jgi:hypothetical protein
MANNAQNSKITRVLTKLELIQYNIDRARIVDSTIDMQVQNDIAQQNYG